jgi:hypothetical protein
VIVRGQPVAWTDVPADTSVPECDAYLRAFNEYMRCDKIPEQARESSGQAIQQMVAAFQQLKDPSVPAEAKQQAAQACTQAIDALRQAASALGCTVP